MLEIEPTQRAAGFQKKLYSQQQQNHEGERGLEGNGAAVCVGLGSALCQVVQGRCGGLSDLGLRGEVRDAGKRVAWFGVAAWDVGHDWMLTSASVMALASFGLVLVAVRIFALFAEWCSRA